MVHIPDDVLYMKIISAYKSTISLKLQEVSLLNNMLSKNIQ